MTIHMHDPEEYELVGRDSDSNDGFDLDDSTFQVQGHTAQSYSGRPTLLSRLGSLAYESLPSRKSRKGYRKIGARRIDQNSSQTIRRPSRIPRRCRTCMHVSFILLGILIFFTAIFRPSYTKPPQHYSELRKRATAGSGDGRANPQNQTVFIAATLYDRGGKLLGGSWGDNVLQLIELLGTENVYLSIYQNGGGADAQAGKATFRPRIPCRYSLVFDTEFSMDELPRVKLPDGSMRIRRIEYLAELRNRALQPLTEEAELPQFDKLLYLNDVVFDPVEAAQLLLSTNLDGDGNASYRAACAVDFINPFKFYDTFATRDTNGYSMGVPFYPWFSSAGSATSRSDVLRGKDAVRVRSCWGGMVAFDARPFQTQAFLRFRSIQELYWEASECCLIHADLATLGNTSVSGESTGIYLNPFVRVAYGTRTLRWLYFTRRFESLYTIPHTIVNSLASLPRLNPRREDFMHADEEVKVWVPNGNIDAGGAFEIQTRPSNGDGFCGFKTLQVLKKSLEGPGKNWESLPVPTSRV